MLDAFFYLPAALRIGAFQTPLPLGGAGGGSLAHYLRGLKKLHVLQLFLNPLRLTDKATKKELRKISTEKCHKSNIFVSNVRTPTNKKNSHLGMKDIQN